MKYFLILISGFFLTACSFSSSSVQDGNNGTATGVENIAAPSQSRESRLEESKRRRSFLTIIRKGDYFSLKKDQETAVRYYLNAYLRLKSNDHVLERKIAATYFDLKQFAQSYKYYKRIPFVDLSSDDQKQMVSALLFDETAPDISGELKKLPLSPEDEEYYQSIVGCYNGIHDCVISLQAYSGSVESVIKLRNTTTDYTKVSTDFQYRNMLLAGAFFEAKQYLAALKIAREITEKRPDYHVALKIAGYAAYELGEYKDANGYLGKYYEYDPKDIKTTYTLGLANFYLGDFALSNLYFNTAVLNGYTPKTELERRLAYNYYILGDTKSMMKIFYYLLKESDVSEDDFIIAVHTAVEINDIAKAFLWANAGLEKFTDSDMLFALRASIHLARNDAEHAVVDIDRATTLNPGNPLVLLDTAKLYFLKNEYTLSKEYIQKTIAADTDGVFAEEGKQLLETINKTESGSGTTASGSTTMTGTNLIH